MVYSASLLSIVAHSLHCCLPLRRNITARLSPNHHLEQFAEYCDHRDCCLWNPGHFCRREYLQGRTRYLTAGLVAEFKRSGFTEEVNHRSNPLMLDVKRPSGSRALFHARYSLWRDVGVMEFGNNYMQPVIRTAYNNDFILCRKLFRDSIGRSPEA